MLYINLNDRNKLTFDTVAPFYGKEVTNDGATQAVGMALEAISAQIGALKARLADRTVNYFENEVELEDVWLAVSSIVDERNGRNVPQLVGESREQTLKDLDIAAPMKPRSPKHSKKKA